MGTTEAPRSWQPGERCAPAACLPACACISATPGHPLRSRQPRPSSHPPNGSFQGWPLVLARGICRSGCLPLADHARPTRATCSCPSPPAAHGPPIPRRCRLADLGFDVDIGPLFMTPHEVARHAVDAGSGQGFVRGGVGGWLCVSGACAVPGRLQGASKLPHCCARGARRPCRCARRGCVQPGGGPRHAGAGADARAGGAGHGACAGGVRRHHPQAGKRAAAVARLCTSTAPARQPTHRAQGQAWLLGACHALPSYNAYRSCQPATRVLPGSSAPCPLLGPRAPAGPGAPAGGRGGCLLRAWHPRACGCPGHDWDAAGGEAARGGQPGHRVMRQRLLVERTRKGRARRACSPPSCWAATVAGRHGGCTFLLASSPSLAVCLHFQSYVFLPDPLQPL